MKDKESLKTGAVIGELTNTIENLIDNFLSNGVVTTSIVVGGILLATNDLLGVVELTVRPMANFVTDSRLQIDIDGTRDVLASTSLGKEGIEGVVALSDLLNLKRAKVSGYRLSDRQSHSSFLSDEGVKMHVPNRLPSWCHRVQCHARGNKAPSSCYQSGYQPGPSGWRCILFSQEKERIMSANAIFRFSTCL